MNSDIVTCHSIPDFDRHAYKKTLNLVRDNHLNTVCIEANCPNRYECFSNKIATFMILGDTCTRNCLYCNIKHGTPEEVDFDEARRIVSAIEKMGIKYAVITCVTRDDLNDGGAQHFADVIKAIKDNGGNNKDSKVQVEVLISDLNGNIDALKTIIKAKPDIINHNIEITKDLFPRLRPDGDYNQSLKILKTIRLLNPQIKIKSGLMLGLGESWEQIIETLEDLKQNCVDFITIGQYLAPSEKHAAVEKYYSSIEFEKLKKIADNMGFKGVASGKLVRSSYHAEEMASN